MGHGPARIVAIIKEPFVCELKRGDFVAAPGALHNMVSAAIWDADPAVDPAAYHSMLAFLFPGHHAQIVGTDDDPLLGRPMYFTHRRGADSLRLYPRCDKTYWLRATFRAPIAHGAPPAKAE